MGRESLQSVKRAIICVQAVYQAMTCISTVFFVQVYQRFGIGKLTISLIVMLCNAVSILCQPLWGHWVDRSMRAREIILGCCGISAALYFIMMSSGGAVWVVTLCAVLIYGSFHCMMSLIDSWVARLIRDGMEINYGHTRSAGSLGYAVVAVLFGLAAARFGHGIAPWCFLILYVVLAAALIRIPNPASTVEEDGGVTVRETAKYLWRNKAFLIVAAAMCVNTFSSTSSSTFYSVHIYELGGNETIVGIGTFMMAMTEIPIMYLFSRFCARRRMTPMTMLAAAMFFYFMKGFFLGSAGSIPMVLLFSAFHGLSFGIFQPAVVGFVVDGVEKRYTATAQMLLHAFGQNLPAVLASPVSGLISTHVSTGEMLRLMSVCSLAGMLIVLIGQRALRLRTAGTES